MPPPRPIYNILEVMPAEMVLLFEGEKAAGVAKGMGFTATTSAGGSAAASKTDWTSLTGKTVYGLPDNDDAGREFVNIVAAKLISLDPPARVFLVDLPVINKGDDIADWQARGGTSEQLQALIDAATP